MNSWKTTVAGILSIVVALANAGLTFLKTGSVPEIGTLIAAVTAGVGLILAKDAVK
jgi:hypothetical protein